MFRKRYPRSHTPRRLNQGGFFHRAGGNDSSKPHSKGGPPSFEKYAKREDPKELKDDQGYPSRPPRSLPPENPSQPPTERYKEDRPREHNGPVHPAAAVEEMTRLLLKLHSSRFKEFRRQMHSGEPESDLKSVHSLESKSESHEAPHKSYRPSYGYRSSYSRDRGHDRHKYKPDR